MWEVRAPCVNNSSVSIEIFYFYLDMKKKDVKWDPSVEAFKSMQQSVRSALTNCAPGDEFEALVRVLQYNIPGQEQVRKDVMAAFRRHYSGVFTDDQLHLFGSSVMGIAFKGKTIDRS